MGAVFNTTALWRDERCAQGDTSLVTG